MRVLLWNSHTLTQQKLRSHDIAAQLAAHDVVGIVETGIPHHSRVYTKFFPHYTAHRLDAPRGQSAGAGIVALVARHMARHVRMWRADTDVACLWLELSPVATGLARPLRICFAYIPPQTSRAVATVAGVSARFQGGATAAPPPAGRVPGPVAACLLPPRYDDSGLNTAGGLLAEVCRANDLIVLTGRTPDDCPAPCSYHHRNGTSRPDHLAVDFALVPHISSHHLLHDRMGSDHQPLSVTISSLEPPVREAPAVLPSLHPRPPCLRLPARPAGIVAPDALPLHVVLSAPAFQAALSTAVDVAAADPDAADVEVTSLLRIACIQAGYSVARQRERPPTPRAGTRCRHRVGPSDPFGKAAWLTPACRHALAAWRQARARRPRAPLTRCLERVYKRLSANAYAAHKSRVADEYAAMLACNPNGFWQALRALDKRIGRPACPADLHECKPFFESLFTSPTPTPTMHPVAQSSAPALGTAADCPDHILNVPISHAEVADAVRKLHRGRASGHDGLPAEAVKGAQPPRPPAPLGVGGSRPRRGRGGQQPPRPPAPPNPLLSPLTRMFDTLFQHGTAPASWAHTLVSLLFKKGDPTLWANYRPIAVVNLLAKLYAIILNNRHPLTCADRVPAGAGHHQQHFHSAARH